MHLKIKINLPYVNNVGAVSDLGLLSADQSAKFQRSSLVKTKNSPTAQEE